jgi:hypothetical protein
MARFVVFMVLVFAPSAMALAETPPSAATTEKNIRRSSVGMPARIEQLVIDGTELEAKPIDDRKAPLVLRVVAAYRHGTAFRYDLEYYALEPGHFDLGDYLRRKDGSHAALPKIPVEIASLLPRGQVTPRELPRKPVPRLGGYRMALAAVGVAWLLGLAAIVFYRRGRRAAILDTTAPSVSLANRLRPLVTAALDGRLDSARQAELERLLLGYWSRRLGLDEVEPTAALARLRADEQAGKLLRQVEAWLHAPEGARQVDLATVLAPYRDLPDNDPPLERALATADEKAAAPAFAHGAGVAR